MRSGALFGARLCDSLPGDSAGVSEPVDVLLGDAEGLGDADGLGDAEGLAGANGVDNADELGEDAGPDDEEGATDAFELENGAGTTGAADGAGVTVAVGVQAETTTISAARATTR